MAVRSNRDDFGFLLIDKPKEVSSFYVVRTLRKLLDMKRIGYAGTLDPLATGLMIVAVGEATKLLNALEQTDKVYDVVIRLGARSETYDAEGPVVMSDVSPEVPREVIEKVIRADFLGKRRQIPPRYSAVKIGGKHAYELVRKGKEVNIPAKDVEFFDVQVRSFEYPLLECSVHCSAGTYIRSFASDLGEKLGCGAYVAELRRTKIGEHLLADAVALDKLTPQNCREHIVPPEKFLKDWRQCEVDAKEYGLLCHGGFIPNRWKEKLRDVSSALAVFEGKTVGLLEPCEEGRSLKFAKKFNLG